jgi:alpha-glucosidase
MDSNGDGIGDLQGIIDKLDYLDQLGIDAIWISPIYPSPMADFGYDVADYVDIHPMFGDLKTFDRLLAEAHQRGMKVILDYVPNHSSHEHEWFLESRSSRDNPKRDWYIWRDAKPDGSPPNNWGSAFGGSAWEWDDTTEQYYLHLFTKEQPDLNWRNPAVREAMYEALRFWFDRGVDGFRVDVACSMIKDEQLRDQPYQNSGFRNPTMSLWDQQDHCYDLDQPEVHGIIRDFRAIADDYKDRVLIGEVWFRPIQRWTAYYGEELKGFHLPFNFGLMEQPWRADGMRAAVSQLEDSIPVGAWPNNVLGNHDSPRLATRFGREAVRTAAMMLLTLRGTPTIYMGEEIGMEDGEIPLDRLQDPPALIIGPENGRDPCRTPFQWSDEAFAGFSTVEPWLPVAAGYETRNVKTQSNNPTSVLALYRHLLRYRRETAALNRGNYRALTNVPATCFAYLREYEGERRLVVLNFGGTPLTLSLADVAARGEIVLSTELDRSSENVDLANLKLRPYEGLIVQL